MKKITSKKIFIFFLFCLVAFLLISVSFTFGTSNAGKGFGAFEGILVLLLGLWYIFSPWINPAIKKFNNLIKTKIIQPIKKKS